jgi:Haemolysin-III related
MKILEEHLTELENYAYDRITNIHPIDYVDSSLQPVADLAKQSLDQLTAAIKNGAKRLLTIDEIPSDWHNNPHILRGYRFYATKFECLKSILHIHNETGNIWTHILGFFFVLAIGVWYYPRSESWEIATATDKLVVAVFLFAALECLACSTIWHVFSNFANLAAMKKIACVGMSPFSSQVNNYSRLRWDFSVDCCVNFDGRVSWILLSTCGANRIHERNDHPGNSRNANSLARMVRQTVPVPPHTPRVRLFEPI